MAYHKNNAELFADARRSLLGHLGTAVWGLLLYLLIDLFLGRLTASVSFGNIYVNLAIALAAWYVTSLFASLFGIGLSCIFLNLQYGQPARIRSLFTSFYENADKSVRLRAFVTAGEFLCLLPFQTVFFFTSRSSMMERFPLILGVSAISLTLYMIWSLTFAMANFLLLDFPQMEAGKILRASRNMMRGNRKRLFLLFMRVLPMHLLGVFSLGVANLYAGVCQHACAAAFYKDMMSGE